MAGMARTIGRNIAGYALVCIGILLSLPLVPGPGFAVVLLGLALADWPGKVSFFKKLHSFSWVRGCEDWVHQKFGIRLPES